MGTGEAKTACRTGLFSPLTLRIEDLFRPTQQDFLDELYLLSAGFERSVFHDELTKNFYFLDIS